MKKKADRNCRSADPNDCLVWCLVEVKGGIGFTDYVGQEYQEERYLCPDDFDYSSSDQCIRRSLYSFAGWQYTDRSHRPGYGSAYICDLISDCSLPVN